MESREGDGKPKNIRRWKAGLFDSLNLKEDCGYYIPSFVSQYQLK
jgi:hypothetical protein